MDANGAVMGDQELTAADLRALLATVLAEHIRNGCTNPACNPGPAADEIPRPFIHHLAAEIVAAWEMA
jgi:hypothetical protein